MIPVNPQHQLGKFSFISKNREMQVVLSQIVPGSLKTNLVDLKYKIQLCWDISH